VPGDRFTFAIFISSKKEFIGILHVLFKFFDLLLLIGVDHIEGSKTLFDVDTLFSPGELLIFLRDIRSSLWQIADMPDRCLYNIVIAEIACDLSRFRRRLDDDEFLRHLLLLFLVVGEVSRC
jgi:hypothetical protein